VDYRLLKERIGGFSVTDILCRWLSWICCRMLACLRCWIWKTGFSTWEWTSQKYTTFVVLYDHYEFWPVQFIDCVSVVCQFNFQRSEVYCTGLHGWLIIPCSSNNAEKDIERLRRMLGVGLDLEEVLFPAGKIEFLGHVFWKRTHPSNKKIEAVQCFPEPTNIKQLQSFLSLSSYFRKFPEYAIIHSLSNLLRTGVKFDFGREECFSTIDIKKSVLDLYRVKAETELHMDASALVWCDIAPEEQRDNFFIPFIIQAERWYRLKLDANYEFEILTIIKRWRDFESIY